jgi:molybdopterin/thiamine biosynthesis adenylyltransferase
MDRYQRQSIFRRIGPDGQKTLLQARVAVIGIGALGTVIANNLARAGVGYLRLIDRDCVELHNLHRQMIFTEDDARAQLPKAIAAQKILAAANSEVLIEGLVADFNASNALALLETIDLVVDGTDNRETRYLLDEACHARRIPWIYGGVLGSTGMTMNIIPGQTACYHCLTGHNDQRAGAATCSTSGVLNMITSIIASYQSMEAIKILLHDPDVRTDLLCLDIWTSQHLAFPVDPMPDCPVCQLGQYQQLSQPQGSLSKVLCGQDAMQVVPGTARTIDFPTLAARLNTFCDVTYNAFMLTLRDGSREISLFRDGRAIIRNVRDEGQAKSLYAEYFGL